MRREGSPWTGVGAVFQRELADNLLSVRMRLLELLVLLTGTGAVYAAIGEIKNTVGEDPFVFLRIFTIAREPLPSFTTFLAFLIPIVAIALAFDRVNGEFSRRTMSRILAQPIYRDALLFGKFLAGLATLAVFLTGLWLFLMGLGHDAWGAAERRGDFTRPQFPSHRRRLWGRLARPRAVVLYRVPRTGDGSAGGALVLAPVRRVLGNDRAAAHRARIPSRPLRSSFTDQRAQHRDGPQPPVAQHPFRRNDPCAAQPRGPGARSGVCLSASWRARWRSPSSEPKPAAGLAAADRPDRRSILLFSVGYVVFQRQEVRA